MDYKYITDITHLFPKDPMASLPDELLKFRTYLGRIISAATVTGEAEFQSALPCRKRVNRRPCPGFIQIIVQSLPQSYIYWHCSSCEDGGRISNWRNSIYDQSTFPELPTDEPNPMVEVLITRDELNAVLDGAIYDPPSDRIVYRARPRADGILLQGRYEVMDNFVGYLAADANHEKSKKRQKLIDTLYEKVDAATQQAYDDAELGEPV